MSDRLEPNKIVRANDFLGMESKQGNTSAALCVGFVNLRVNK